MKLLRSLAPMLGLCLLLTASPGWAQSAAPSVAATRPSLMITAQRLERLQFLAKGRSFQWRALQAWALEPARQATLPHDGPGLALAALATKPLDAEQAKVLGQKAVACALAGAPLGQVQGVSGHQLSDPKRLGSTEKYLELGYGLVNPRLEQDQVWRVLRYAPNGVMVEETGTAIQGAAKAGDTYALLMDDPLKAERMAGDVALTLDWAWEWFAPEQRQKAAAWLVAQAKVFAKEPGGCFDRRATAMLKVVGLAGMAARGLHPEAQALMDQARKERFDKEILPCLRGAGQGGAWFEGSHAGAVAGLNLLEYMAAVRSLTGEDLLGEAPWFNDRLAFLVQHILPGVATAPRGGYRLLMPDGDPVLTETEASDLVRLQMLMLASLRPKDPSAGWGRALALDRRTPRVLTDHYLGLEFLWLEPEAPPSTWTAIPLTYAAEGMGRAFSRSDWSELATWVGFNCGPHFTAAQHLDAGSLVIFKQGTLLGRGGVFDGPATPHRLNYAMRTLAHNTVVVVDPQEYSWYDLGEGVGKRGAYANDGGQRAMSLFDDKGQPTQGAPWTASGWESGPAPWTKNRQVYEVASMDAVEDMPRFSYMRGIATGAYKGSTAKVNRLVRHVFHLRAGGADDAEAAEVVAVMDDLEVAKPDLVGRAALHFPTRPESDKPLSSLGPGRWRGDAQALGIKAEETRLEVVSVSPTPTQVFLYGEKGVADSWVGDRNHPPRPPAVNPMPWRAEIGPAEAKGTHQPLVQAFLPAALAAPPSPKLTALKTQDPAVVGLVIADKRWPRWVALHLGQPQPDIVVSYEFNGVDSRHLVAGLVPRASYNVTVKDGRVVVAPGTGLVSSKAGLLAFMLSTRPLAE